MKNGYKLQGYLQDFTSDKYWPLLSKEKVLQHLNIVTGNEPCTSGESIGSVHAAGLHQAQGAQPPHLRAAQLLQSSLQPDRQAGLASRL